MDSLPFEKSFLFRIISQFKYRHTDASHGVDYNFLALLLEGHAHIESDTESIDIYAGDAFFIPIGCRYHSYWYGVDTVRWASLGFIHFPGNKGYSLQKLDFDDSQRNCVISIAERGTVDCNSVGQLYSLLAELEPSMKKDMCQPWQHTVDCAVKYMSNAPKASMAEVAKFCNVSESGLYTAFRASGTTPALMRQSILIDRAVTLITTTDLSADEIADRCGFSSTAYFLRVLKKHTGKTTREIRRSTEI